MEITRKSVYIFEQENVLKIKSRITELYIIQKEFLTYIPLSIIYRLIFCKKDQRAELIVH